MNKPYPTPHINATPEDFAKTVLMPGDPLRAKFIAETYLTDAVLINNVRGIQGYTGLYKGKPVSVMASGMGMPSMGIYSYELFNFFGVENIIRIGSAGSLQENVNIRSIVLGQGACSVSAFCDQFCLSGNFAPIASYELLEKAVSEARKKGVEYHIGNLLSSDNFYTADKNYVEKWQKMGVLACEMEAAALYANAAVAGKKALAICTVSDSMLTFEGTTADERQTGFTQMMEIALEVAISME